MSARLSDVGRRAQGHSVPGEALVALLAGGGDAEIHELHVALVGEQDVARLDVTVNDALVMGVLQGLAHLVEDQHGGVVGEVALLAQKGLEGDPIDELLDDVVGGALLEVVVDVHDVVVLDIHHDPRFALEALDQLGAAPQGELLQQHETVQGGMLGSMIRMSRSGSMSPSAGSTATT
jgi:hypothetical protein